MLIVGNRRGRPPRAGVRASSRVFLKLTADERRALEKVAKENHQPLSAVVREAVNLFVGDYSELTVFLRTGIKPR